MTERVLVLPRAEVPGGTDFTGIRALTPRDAEAIRAAVAHAGTWLDRDRAEQDPSHKQLIPYVVVRDRSGPAERVFLMERTDAGGDPRLHRRATIGVGGHLNPVDGGTDPLSAGLHREWREELAAAWEPEFVAIGLLNDDRNPVGSVHLGVVFEVEAAGRELDVRERDKLSGRMVAVVDLAEEWERMETWSQLVAAAIWGEPGA
jgi:predicted NUDIX family phosphoesterase